MKRSRAAARLDEPPTPSAIPAVVAVHPPSADFAHATCALVLTVAADPGAVPVSSVAKAPPVLPAGWVAPSAHRKFMIEITDGDQWRRVQQAARSTRGGAGARGSIAGSAAASSFLETNSCAAAAEVPTDGRPRRSAHLRAKRLLEHEHAHAISSGHGQRPAHVAGASMHGVDPELSASAAAFHRCEVDAAMAALLQKAASFKRRRLQLAAAQWPFAQWSDPVLLDRSLPHSTTSDSSAVAPRRSDSAPSEPRQLDRWLRDDAKSAVCLAHDAQAGSAATVGRISSQDQDQRPHQLHFFFQQQPSASTKNAYQKDNQSRVQLRSLFHDQSSEIKSACIGLAAL